MATIYDVSKRAGVSTATVSRVLNNNPKVDPDLRQQVMLAVSELRYVPNASARSLVTKQTYRVGLIISDITNPFFAETARGAQDALDDRGYQLLLANSDDQPQRELRYLGTFAQAGVDGLLIEPAMTGPQSVAGQRSAQRKLAKELEALGVPIVSYSPHKVAINADSVGIDEELAGFKATDHLLNLGNRRIALINGPTQNPVGIERAQGYRRALERHGVPFEADLTISTLFRQDEGYKALRSLLERGLAPTAVFAGDDQIALGVLLALEEAGLAVPRDVAIVCVGDAQVTAASRPSLTSVTVPRGYEFGRLGAQLLLERMGGTYTGAAREVVLETRLLIRDSTATGLVSV